MNRKLAFAFGIVVYGIFLLTFLYAIGFLENVAVPKSIDSGRAVPLGQSLPLDFALLSVFALQHSIMARQSFKRWWTRAIPPAIERSTYVLFSSLALILLFWQWRPLPEELWQVDFAVGRYALQGLFLAGWMIALVGTLLVSHVELFGLRQVYLNLRREKPATAKFRTPGLYRYVRHPIYFGFLIAIWSTPSMTMGHLLFAAASTGYILVGSLLEERDLVKFHGEAYRRYQHEVPKLIPFPPKIKVRHTD
jgi:protein-S-isoprenylcysteine O-methyltransferase Ste14